MTAELIHILQEVRAAVPHIDWQKLYEAAMLEMNPDKLATRIGAAEQRGLGGNILVPLSESQLRPDGVWKPMRPEPNVWSVMGRKNCADSLTKFRSTGAVSTNATQPGT